MNKTFREAKKLLKKAMTGNDNAVIMATMIYGGESYYGRGNLDDMLLLITNSIHCIFEHIIDEQNRDNARDMLIEALNKEVGIE